MGKIIAIVNQKGGVGKTTTAINLSTCIAVTERRTLIVDMDPQGNTTTGFGIDRASLNGTVYDGLLGKLEMESLVYPSSIEWLKIIPSSIDLVGAEIELVDLKDRETRLRKMINKIKDKFEYILIDCPPSLGLLTINSLTAADSALVPLQCEFYALEGLTQLMKTIRLIRERLNPYLYLEGIVLTMFDSRTSLSAQVKAEAENYFKNKVFKTVIPRNVRLSEAPSHGKPIIQYDIKCQGAIAYLQLAKEVILNAEKGVG